MGAVFTIESFDIERLSRHKESKFLLQGWEQEGMGLKDVRGSKGLPEGCKGSNSPGLPQGREQRPGS